MYKALHDDITIKKSSIHGMGIFAIKDIPKNLSQKINIDSIERQKSLCEGLLDDRGNSRCKFVEHDTYVSNKNNDKS